MGKVLIIKGADFSHTALAPREPVWAFGLSESELGRASSGKTFFQPADASDSVYAFSSGADTLLQGHTVRKLRLYAHRTGSLSIMRFDRTAFTTDMRQTIRIDSTGIVTADLTELIPVDATHTIGIGYTADAPTKYLEGTGVGYPFDLVTLSTRSVTSGNCTFAIDYAY